MGVEQTFPVYEGMFPCCAEMTTRSRRAALVVPGALDIHWRADRNAKRVAGITITY
jgi:hypothetical protein